MRCLTLAEGLAARGADCHFICREHEGNLNKLIRSMGYLVYALPAPVQPVVAASPSVDAGSLAEPSGHQHWLGVTQEKDADDCTAIVARLHPDWLIVDHYSFDTSWEAALKPYYGRLMVIDDLADRPHISDLLLDQTFGRGPHDYEGLLPAGCQLLCGSQYALLRPEFVDLRSYSLHRRAAPQLRELLITLGGVDKDNITGQVLEALRACPLPADCRITVVMGPTSPWLSEVERQARLLPWPAHVRFGVNNMAELMAKADLAIGAAGATSWERCCLGLPTILLVLAENQQHVARSLAQAGAAYPLAVQEIVQRLPSMLTSLLEDLEALKIISRSAAQITDGRGTATVINFLEA